MSGFFDKFARDFAFLGNDEAFPRGAVLPVEGVCGQSIPLFTALLRRFFGVKGWKKGAVSVLVVTSGSKVQEVFQQDLQSWSVLGKMEPPDFFPSWEVLPSENRLPSVDVIGERLGVVLRLLAGAEGRCIVTQVESVLQKTFSAANLRKRLRVLECGKEADPVELMDWLEKQGYDAVAKVAQRGEFAVRGGIVDIFPLSTDFPVRVEFFGDDVESIREFDPNTQLSLEEKERVEIPPAGEFGMLKNAVEGMAPGGRVEDIAVCLTDYLPKESVLVVADPAGVWESLNAFRGRPNSWSPIIEEFEFLVRDFLTRGGRICAVGDCDLVDLQNLFGNAKILEPRTVRMESPEVYCPFPSEGSLEVVEQYREGVFSQVVRWLLDGYSCQFCFANEGEDKRIRELWEESVFGRPVPELVQAGISRGVVMPDSKFALLTDNDIFCRRKVQRSRRLKKKHAASVRSQLEIDFDHIEKGDLVVHVQYGIARYRGIGQAPRGVSRYERASTDSPECLILEFAPDDALSEPPLLYIPVTESHLVSKYIGVGRAHPPLSRLGGKAWAKARAAASKAVEDIASDLLHIQARREEEKGFAFPPDTDWQHTFENAFEFEETPDQLRAIEDTKRDMECDKSMDRLVCGDVGFGKTEVAIRAAFKAVMSGKQVALLAPTTVLVQQHYNTFRERMAGYPVRIDVVSRFRTKKTQKQILERVKNGEVDIIVGTHRLVQKDVEFKNLGLFIVDEEQRFGVKQKEQIKRMRALTDVLTLTATPIPRTLYMALAGVKSMSAIETAPQERLPVKTIVSQYDDDVIREAIQRELNRQGQVFFLHNRVKTIESVEYKLRKLVPHARILVGHGQMSSDDLEKVMTKFVNGEADILLSTTIIESGIDIPNANTIIIDRADRFGLSELYQLRGRVGRYRNQAYAYLLIPRHASLLADARKRISAIKQYSRLGSGFKIAMRDLEIRGAGNILGSEQSGHITAIGFDLYCKLLQTSICRLRGEKPVEHIDTKMVLDFLCEADGEDDEEVSADSHQVYLQLSSKYIADPVQRLEIYRRLALTHSLEEVNALAKELVDRFGKCPVAVDYLLQVYRIRAVAGQKKISSIESQDNKIIITRNGRPLMVGSHYPQFTKKTRKGRLKELLFLVESLHE